MESSVPEAKTEKMDWNFLTRKWFEFATANILIARPIHGALYIWILYKGKSLKWPKVFPLSTEEACLSCCVSKKEPILKAIKDLESWGFIKIIREPKNRFSDRLISIMSTRENKRPQ